MTKTKNNQSKINQKGGVLPLVIFKAVFEAFKFVGMAVFYTVKGVLSPGPDGKMSPTLKFIVEFLKFSVKSSIILMFFLMGGPFFIFLGIFYTYFKLFKKIKERNSQISDAISQAKKA